MIHRLQKLNLQWVGIGLGILYWFIESLLDSFLFHQGSIAERIFVPDPNELWMRLLVISTLIIFGYYAQKSINMSKQADYALKMSEDRYLTLFDSMGEGLGIQDKNGFITFINKRACEMLGYKSDELLGRLVSFLLDEENQKIMQEQMKQRHEGKHQRYEIAFRRKDGVNVPTIISPAPLFDEKGNFEGSIAVFTDITERKRAEQERALFRALLDRSNDAIEVVDPETGRFLDMNEKALLDLNYSREELPFLRVWDIDPTVDQLSFTKIIEGLRKSGSIIFNSYHQRKDGSKFPVEINLQYVQLDRDYVITVVRDVTERKKAEDALLTSEEKFRALAEQSIVGTCLIQDGKFVYVNNRLAEILDFRQEEMLGLTVLDIVAERDRDTVKENMRKRISGEVSNIRYTFHALKKGGSEVPMEAHGSAMKYLGRPAIIATVLDITERKAAEEKIKHMAYHDTLTDLPNRALFYDRLQQAILYGQREDEPVTLMFLDMNDFKKVNDTHGHHYGDLLLKQLSHRIKGILRESDTVARIGGDEFAIILPRSEKIEGAVRTAKKITEAIRAPFTLKETTLDIAVSIGIVVFPDHGEDIDILTQRADTAMYAAKRSGKDFVVHGS